MSDTVLLAIQDQIATITLNRPKVFNAMNQDMGAALREAAQRVLEDDGVRAVLLRGAGAAFMAGGDVAMFHAHRGKLPPLILRMVREFNYAIIAFRRMRKPLVTSVQGAVAGAGISLVALSDLTIAADNTQFTMAYSRIATTPDGGGSLFLPQILGYKKAMEIMLLSDACDAHTAQQLGLVNWVVPLAELERRTAALMQRLASGPTFAYAQTKALVNRAFDPHFEAHLEAEAQSFAACAATSDLAEGVAAFVEKRKAVFTGK